jgi:hypothetical protein
MKASNWHQPSRRHHDVSRKWLLTLEILKLWRPRLLGQKKNEMVTRSNFYVVSRRDVDDEPQKHDELFTVRITRSKYLRCVLFC